jgi:hypothetical protein
MKRFLAAGAAMVVLAVAITVLLVLSVSNSYQALAGNSCTQSTPGVLPGSVPQPFNSIFTAASAHWKIDPALEAAIFMSEHGNSWPAPDSVQANSPAGALGWFQFMPPTWAAYSNSNPAHPIGNPQDLTDSAYAAAHYLSVLGGSVNMQPGNPMAPITGTVAWVSGSYNGGAPIIGNAENDHYRANSVQQYILFKGGIGGSALPVSQSGSPSAPQVPPSTCNVPVNADGLVNPFLKVPTLCPHRIDMGVDYCGSGTVAAIGHAYIYIATTSAGWPGGGFVGHKLLDGAFAGKYVYLAEHITPLVQQGQTVQPGQPIATMYAGYPWIETGWASGTGAETLAAHLHQEVPPPGDAGGWMSAAGVSFNRLLMKLGVPSGETQPGGEHGTMPAGYP